MSETLCDRLTRELYEQPFPFDIVVRDRPGGHSPDWVQDDWRGCVLRPVARHMEIQAPAHVCHLETREPFQLRDAYLVPIQQAIDELEFRERFDAANYWREQVPHADFIGFERNCVDTVLKEPAPSFQ